MQITKKRNFQNMIKVAIVMTIATIRRLLLSKKTIGITILCLIPVIIFSLWSFDVFPKETAKEYLANLKKVFKTKKSFSQISKVIIQGKEYWLNNGWTPVKSEAGDIVAAIVVCRDITKEEKETILLKAKNKEKAYTTLFKVSYFCKRNLSKIVVGSIIFIIGTMFLINYITHLLSIPLGLSAIVPDR